MRQPPRGERLILIAVAVLSAVVHAVAYSRWRFDSDEPQHLHVAWGWTAGLLQYRDVFDNHAPLFHILTAPMLKAVGERADVLLYMRAPMVVLFAVVVWSTYIIGRRLYSERIGLWSGVMISLFPIYFLKSIEYRTDNLWVTLWCLTLVAITGGRLTPLRMFAAGLLLGCAAATSMNVIASHLARGGRTRDVACQASTAERTRGCRWHRRRSVDHRRVLCGARSVEKSLLRRHSVQRAHRIELAAK